MAAAAGSSRSAAPNQRAAAAGHVGYEGVTFLRWFLPGMALQFPLIAMASSGPKPRR